MALAQGRHAQTIIKVLHLSHLDIERLCANTQSEILHQDTVSERLRRWTRNPLGSARRGSNPLGVDSGYLSYSCSPSPFLFLCPNPYTPVSFWQVTPVVTPFAFVNACVNATNAEKQES